MRRLLAAVLPLALLCSMPCRAQAEPLPFKVCMNDVAHHPWRDADATGLRAAERGLDFHFLRMLGSHLNLAVQVELQPWRRCLAEVKAGLQDAVFAASYLPEREDMGLYPKRDGKVDESVALRRDAYHWYIRRGQAWRWDGKRFTLPLGESVGVQAGYSIAGFVRQLGYTVDEGARTGLANLEKLYRERVPAAALQSTQADPLLASHPHLKRGLQRLDPPLQERAYFIVVSHPFALSGAVPMNRFWAGVVAVRDSAEFRALLKASENEGPAERQ